jgi:hypothetical protein
VVEVLAEHAAEIVVKMEVVMVKVILELQDNLKRRESKKLNRKI